MKAEQLFSAEQTSHLQQGAETRRYHENMLQMAWFEHLVKSWPEEEVIKRLQASAAASSEHANRVANATMRSQQEELLIEEFIESGDAVPEARWYREVFLPSKDFDRLRTRIQTDIPGVMGELDRLYQSYSKPH